MHCPHCDNGIARVIDSRQAARGWRRRRECDVCRRRWTTIEVAEEDVDPTRRQALKVVQVALEDLQGIVGVMESNLKVRGR